MPSKPKLLVILGSGSSIPCGMPSIGQIDNLMKRWSQEWASDTSVHAECDVFKVLWKASKCYYGTNHYDIRPNYERVLGEMTALASWLSPRPFGNPLTKAVRNARPVSELDCLYDYSDKYASRKRVLEQHTFLLETLAVHMRELSKRLDTRTSEFSDYMEFFHRLRDHFDLGVYNLNYDAVARNAMPEAYCGFDDHGNFDLSGVNLRREWGFVYHLHGSVHHCIANNISRPWIIWKEELGGAFTDTGITEVDMAQGFRPIPLTTLLAGGFKLDQLLAEPYQSFYSTLVRHVHEADAILIAGYGFGDLHVNRVLRNRFEGPEDDKPHPQVVILEKSCPHRYRTARLEIHEFWSWELRHTLNTTFSDGSGYPTKDTRTVSDYIEYKDFEKDRMNRVAIWHGGFREAFYAIHRIIEWLRRR